jgi:pimeloyl-ACP methyl ester carboxylesterase
MRLSFLCAGAALALLLGGCTMFDSTCEADDRDCLSNPLFAKGVGGACERTADCKAGLYCEDRSCQPRGDADTGEACRLTAECGSSDYCGSQRVCILAGARGVDDECRTTGNCRHGLVCEAPDLSQLGTLSLTQLAEVSGQCKRAGRREQGQTCDNVTDCLAGLACIDCASPGLSCTGTLEPGDKICISLAPSDFELPAIPLLWTGVECPDVDDDATPETYFAVPRGSSRDPAEFYSLPFPNDIRLSSSGIDLDGHPVPPASFSLPFVSRYVQVAAEDLDGFSTNPVALFRFSHEYDFGSVGSDCSGVKIVDITPGSSTYGEASPVECRTTSGDLSNYICPHWLGVRPLLGFPLKPGTTYAAIVTSAVVPCGERDSQRRCTGGGNFARGEDFAAMLASSAPSDGVMRDAWDAYAPLRTWIDDSNQNASAILNAAVFTTQEPEAIVPKLRERIHAEAPPAISDLTTCTSADTTSPCQVGERGRCPAPSTAFKVLHGRIRLPIFQQGTAPYLQPEDGGGFELDTGGAPMVQRHEQVCFAMSLPAAPAPASGYPVLVYAHGTGGSFNGEMGAGGFAQTLATASEPAVLIAIDLPQHGARRGASDDEPEGLFYNFLNPRAARDNVLQGAADLMAVVRFVRDGGVMVGSVPVAFDVDRIGLMGHSQGATHSSLIASYEPDVRGVVLSGNGGHLSTSMLTKTMPVDIAAVVPIGLLDPDRSFRLAGGGFNPALAIIQSVFDRADPINYARRVRRDPLSGTTGVHVFMTYGLGDTFSPEETQQAYVAAAGFPVVQPVLNDFGISRRGLSTIPAPAIENVTISGTPRTIGVRQYSPSSGVDGHFVATRAGEDGRSDVNHFLELLFDGSPPAIGR